MKPATHHVPPGMHAVSPYLIVKVAAKQIDFLKHVFGAEETFRHADPEGTVWHAELKIGDSIVEVADSSEKWGVLNSALHVYVPDVDAAYKRAIDAGATSAYPVKDMFYGERSGGVKDPFGNTWYIATFKEELTKEEIEQRSAENVKAQSQG
ncbi:MAG: VOC family protein [Candidatus Eiseniibacteriota bacterium]